MKKAIIGSAIVLTLVGGSTATLVALNQPKQETHTVSKPLETPTAEETVPEPVEVVDAPEEPVTTVKEQVSAPEPTSHPTNEDLIVEFGWDKMANNAVYAYINRWPHYFTDTERQAAFQYMHDAGKAYCEKRGIDPNLSNINFCWITFMQRPVGDARLDDWVRIGELVGIDTSRYQ